VSARNARKQIVRDRTPGWRDSRTICTLSDGDRHLGHIIQKDGQWYCFDGTHLNETRTGFRRVGTFQNIHTAKAAVEGSCAMDAQVSRMWAS
jgi:hypothetical protein